MARHCEACMKIAAENHRISCLSKNYYYKLIRANCQHVIIEKSSSEQITKSNREIREYLIENQINTPANITQAINENFDRI